MRIEYTAGLDYQLHKRCETQTNIRPDVAIRLRLCSLSNKGVLRIYGGFAWNGLSGGAFDTRNSMPGSAAHDALYMMLRSGKLDAKWREEVDNEMRRILREDGVWRFRRWYLWKAVRRWASFAAAPENRRKIIRAGRGS